MLKNQTNLLGVKQQLQEQLNSATQEEARGDLEKKMLKVEGALEVFEGLQKKYALVDRTDWEKLLQWVNDAKEKLTGIAFEPLPDNSQTW